MAAPAPADDGNGGCLPAGFTVCLDVMLFTFAEVAGGGREGEGYWPKAFDEMYACSKVVGCQKRGAADMEELMEE
jgi:hypothetical protein